MNTRVISMLLLLCAVVGCQHKEEILMVPLEDNALQWVDVQSDATLVVDHIEQEARWLLAQAVARAECVSTAAHRAPAVVRKRVNLAPSSSYKSAPPVKKRRRGVDLNTASMSELQKLPRVGPVLAQAIIDGRPYRSVDDLLRVRGVGKKTLENMRSMLSAPGENEDSSRTEHL